MYFENKSSVVAQTIHVDLEQSSSASDGNQISNNPNEWSSQKVLHKTGKWKWGICFCHTDEFPSRAVAC